MNKYKSYIGSKIILASEMGYKKFNEVYKNTKVDEDVDGYHVIYSNLDGTVYYSWSPKDVFENSYRLVTSGEATFIDNTYKDILPPSSEE